MHPILAPGTHLLRRGRDQAQAGLDPDLAVPLPGCAPDHPDTWSSLVLGGLASADDRAVRTALPPVDADDPWPRHATADLARRYGERVGEVAETRRSTEVSVVGFAHPLSEVLAEDLRALCTRAGLVGPPTTSRHRLRRPRRSLTVLVGVGEPSRSLVDPLVREGTPHLLVRLCEGRAVVGPFVEPGRTACLRCTDAHRTTDDPCWPLLVEQYARLTRTDRADGIPEPVDPTLAALALAWAARDLATYAEGGVPSTLGTTVHLAPGLTALETRAWSPHPQCGCSWS